MEPFNNRTNIVAHKLCITSVNIFRKYLFTTQGSLLAYRKFEGTLNPDEIVTTLEIFSSEKHVSYMKFEGLDSCEEFGETFLVICGRGGSRVFFVTEQKRGQLNFQHISSPIDYWVIAAHWIPTNPKALVTLSSENQCVIYDVKDQLILKKYYHFNDFQIIAGYIFGNTLEDIVVFSGTFGSDIIVWKIVEEQAKTMYILNAHMGWLFNLRFFSNEGLVLSTSDDRSVQAWRFSNKKCPELPLQVAITEGKAEVKLACSCYGHNGRVHDAVYLNGKLFSCGDDEDVCIWNMRGRLLRKWPAHRWSPAWSCGLDPVSGVLCTGGKDGSLALWDIEVEVPCSDVFPVVAPQATSYVTEKVAKFGFEDQPKAVHVYNEDYSIVLMEGGSLMVVGPEPSQGYVLHQYKGPVNQISCSLTANREYLIYANGTFITVMRLGLKINENDADCSATLQVVSPSHVTAAKTKVVGIFTLADDRVLISGRRELFELIILPTDVGVEPKSVIQKLDWKSSLEYPNVTAATVIPQKLLFIGDDCGDIHALSLISMDYQFRFPWTIGCRPTEPIRCLTVLDEVLILSSADNGIIKYFEMRPDLKGCDLALSEETFAIASSFHHYNSEVIEVGFKATEAVLRSLNRKHDILKIHCGGLHRDWNFLIHDNGMAVFSYVRNKEVLQSKFNINNFLKDITFGTHTATINSGVKLMKHFIASGAEDSTIHIMGCKQSITSEKFVRELEVAVHESSVRTLAYQEINDSFGYLVSGGGKSQLFVSLVAYRNNRVVYRQLCYSDVMTGNNPLAYLDCLEAFENAQIRVMDVQTDVSPSNLPHPPLIIFAALSTGVVRVFQTVEDDTKQILLRRYATLTTHSFEDLSSPSIMRVRYVKASGKRNTYIVFGATSSGALLVWNIVMETRPKNHFYVQPFSMYLSMHKTGMKFKNCSDHQKIYGRGITALEVMRCDESHATLVTGGEDGEFKLLEVSLSQSEVRLLWCNSTVHRSTIMCIMKCSDSEFFVSSIDQVLSKWNLIGDKLLETSMGVTDCQSILVENIESGHNVFCFGDGLTVLEVD